MTTATTATATKDTYKPTYWAYIMLPLMGVIFGAFSYYTRGTAISKAFPYFHSFVVLFVMITMERIWMYRKAVSQKHMIWRDLTSTMVQTFMVGAVFGAIFLPVLHFFPNTFFGRRVFFALSDQLGPLWVQVIAVFLYQSLWGYAMHRFEHYNDF